MKLAKSGRNCDRATWRARCDYVLDRDDHRCQYCGAGTTQVAHITPRIHGGTDDPANLVATCWCCRDWFGDEDFDSLAAKQQARQLSLATDAYPDYCRLVRSERLRLGRELTRHESRQLRIEVTSDGRTCIHPKNRHRRYQCHRCGAVVTDESTWKTSYGPPDQFRRPWDHDDHCPECTAELCPETIQPSASLGPTVTGPDGADMADISGSASNQTIGVSPPRSSPAQSRRHARQQAEAAEKAKRARRQSFKARVEERMAAKEARTP